MILQEFKDFALRGNMVDMAVGIVIGAAFQKIVSSFVDDILMPVLGYLIGGVNFTDLVFALNDNVVIRYGNFLQTVIDFTIIAFAVFVAIKVMNKMANRELASTKKK